MKIDGYNAVSMTKQLKGKITNDSIRKNITKIYFFHDKEFNEDYLAIFFKEETVKSTYTDEYMERTDCKLNKDFTTEYSLNEWLKEIAYI